MSLKLEDLTLSSGTIASLTGYKEYAQIDEIQKRFTQFTIGIIASAPNEFKIWQEAWERFEQVYNMQAPKQFSSWCDNPKELRPEGAC